MGVPSRTSASTPALDQNYLDFQIILGKVRPFTSPGRGPSTSSDHCSSGGPGRISDGLTEAVKLADQEILRVETRTLQILTATRGIGFPYAKQVIRITLENSLHWVPDVTYDGDRSTTHIGNGAQFMASLGNTAINRHRLDGATNIAEACPRHRADRQPSPRPPQPAKSQLGSQAF
jgi:hypothetical protein